MIRTVNSTAAILLSVITVLALFLFITPLTTGKAEAESAVTDASAEVLFSSGSRKIDLPCVPRSLRVGTAARKARGNLH